MSSRSPAATEAAPRNRLLAALPPDELRRVLDRLEPVELELRKVVVEPNRPIEHVHFVESGIVSIVSLMADGSAIETATVGNEGMVGLPVFLDAGSMAAQAFVQVAGHGYRMAAADLREEVRRGGALAGALGRYTQALFTLLAQASACNRKHTVDERCARWLLLTHDRAGGDTFELTHLFLSQMLGVRRASVTEVAGRLQAAGFIDYRRGRITVLDRPGLESASCECYAIIRAEFARLLDGASLPSPLDAVTPTGDDGKTETGDGAPRRAGDGPAGPRGDRIPSPA
ncbi:MAG TPA: Crp/Fnr family transcriptional regulator [Longimicrobium sp.]|nr:Crp/Fnr family transcriptional regulator [Longimicrobium sp.]